MNTSLINRILYSCFFVFGSIYVIWLAFMDMPPESTNIPATLIKAVPVSCLAALAFINLKGRTRLLLGFGLILGVGGDISLNIYENSLQTWFVVGLASFLIGHLLYVALFAKEAKFKTIHLLWMALSGGFGLGMAYVLIPKLQGAQAELLIPVMVYLGVITLMVFFAILHGNTTWRLITGAILFMFSDSLIALNSFLLEEPTKVAYLIIMVTYFGGQFFICEAFLKPPKQTEAVEA